MRNIRTKAMYHGYRLKLFDILGSRCVVCGQDNKLCLQIDHKQGSGQGDRSKFKALTGLYSYYTNHPIEALNNLQLLCCNCHQIKSYYPEYKGITRLDEKSKILSQIEFDLIDIENIKEKI